MYNKLMKVSEKELEFSFSRSSGAGGQNVNKVNTKVTLIWDISASKSIGLYIRKRFEEKFSGFITNSGLVKIISQRYRTQPRNISDCIEKLHHMLSQVAQPQKKRIDTKPTKGSIKRRITGKKNKSDIKKTRRKVKY
jgi:ribosome-associated protein